MNMAQPTRPSGIPHRGDIWLVDLDPTVGHEQAGQRPAVVITADQFNRSAAGLVTVLPMTSTRRGVTWHVEVAPPEGNLRRVSYILCEQIRCVSIERLIVRWGSVEPTTMNRIADTVRVVLEL